VGLGGGKREGVGGRYSGTMQGGNDGGGLTEGIAALNLTMSSIASPERPLVKPLASPRIPSLHERVAHSCSVVPTTLFTRARRKGAPEPRHFSFAAFQAAVAHVSTGVVSPGVAGGEPRIAHQRGTRTARG
jgi:hypothetical protein